MPVNVPYKKKLIEVALPLPEINDASAYDKMPGIGPHPKGIHHWWARLPLPTARAVLFASVVDDPEAHPEIWSTVDVQKAERERLFDIIRRLMSQRLHEHPGVYAEAHAEMLKHSGGRLPSIMDPFAGGGSIPLEANRLGFEAHAGDLNPVAVLLNKCNLEIAPRWVDVPPVNPEDRRRIGGAESWHGTRGLAADVRYYGRLIRERAISRIGRLYPVETLPQSHGGSQGTVVNWIWARTVASPDPAMRGKQVPLVSTFWLSNKKGREAWLEPIVNSQEGSYRFEVRTGAPKHRELIAAGTKVGKAGFRCLVTNVPIPFDHVRDEGRKGRLGALLLATLVDTPGGRVWVNASDDQRAAARVPVPSDAPDEDLPDEALGFRVQNYGFTRHSHLYTPRQLTALVTFSELVKQISADVRQDATASGLDAAVSEEYAQAVTTFLALVLDRCASFNNSFCRWNGSQTVFIFTRAAIPMLWDFSEANILGDRAVSWHTAVGICADSIETIAPRANSLSTALQADAAVGNGVTGVLVSTDPPYYDNIGYAALSDVFYVWLRRTVGSFYPELFTTVLVPKMPELTASPERFGGDKLKARDHFESGFRAAFTSLRGRLASDFPLTVYYAFKQDDEEVLDVEDDNGGKQGLTTGWETLLEALISSGFQITATWPVRASFKWRVRALGSNALVSYIVLACRPRAANAERISSTQFRQELKAALPPALRDLQQGNVAPVDFAQAALGPGMAIYSRYSSILDSAGKDLTVRVALSMINQIQAEVLTEQEDDFDADTRWAIAWFELNGFSAGAFGDAEVLTKAKITSVNSLDQAGLVASGAGEVRLLRPEELPGEWDPAAGKLTVWGMTHHLLRVYYHEKAGDEATANLLRKFGSKGDLARDLALRLFRISEKKGLLIEAQAYNALGLGWSELAHLAKKDAVSAPQQARLI
jgi:putative DNA methylase